MTREELQMHAAVVVSLVLHLSAWGLWQCRDVLGRLPFFRPLAKLMEQTVAPHLYTINTARAQPKLETITFVQQPEPERPRAFVETDSSQVTGEQPKRADFYSDKSTVAANKENPTGKTGETPFLNGKETRFLSAETVVPKPGPSTPAIAPLPAPPKPPTPPAQSPVVTPSPPPKPPEPPEKELPAEGIKTAEKMKPVEPLKTTDTPKVAQLPKNQVPFPLSPATGAPAIEVPTPGGGPDFPSREIGAAKAKLKATGISRTGVDAFNVASSPFGEYDKRLIKAVQSRWYALIDRYGIYEGVGEVTIYFQLYDDGTVRGMSIMKSTAKNILGLYCQKAIAESAPFDPLPDDLRKLIGKEAREVNFTFYY